VQEVNALLRGWAGSFRYGNSAREFDKIRKYAVLQGSGRTSSVKDIGEPCAGETHARFDGEGWNGAAATAPASHPTSLSEES
jgi:hypothetical protein